LLLRQEAVVENMDSLYPIPWGSLILQISEVLNQFYYDVMGSFIRVKNLKVGINFEHRYKGQIENWSLKPKNWEKALRLNFKLGIDILKQFLYGFYRSCQYIVSFSNSLLSSTLVSKASLKSRGRV